MDSCLVEKYGKINHEKLKLLLEKVGDESVFFGELRLLGKSEIVYCKEEIGIDFDHIILLVDAMDNCFLVFDILKNDFMMYSVDDDIFYYSDRIEDILSKIIIKSK